MELTIGENDNGRRLDRILRKALPGHPLPLIYRLLRQKQILVNGKPGKAQDRPACGSEITILSLENIPANDFLLPETKSGAHDLHGKKHQPLEILWEGGGLLAVNKPAGTAVHGTDSLETAVRSFLKDKLSQSLSFKPGPLHRLDKPSSGIVVFSSSLEGARLFSALMRERKIKKTYLAIVEGKTDKNEIWHDELVRDKTRKKTFVSNCCGGVSGAENPDSKSAITKITLLEAEGGYSLIKAEIITGRTHQIRAQAAFHGHPLLGDVKYGGKKTANAELQAANDKEAVFFLHAWKLEFLEHSIEAPLPQEFQKMTASLFGAVKIRRIAC